jgi:hypothetical protein
VAFFISANSFEKRKEQVTPYQNIIYDVKGGEADLGRALSQGVQADGAGRTYR